MSHSSQLTQAASFLQLLSQTAGCIFADCLPGFHQRSLQPVKAPLQASQASSITMPSFQGRKVNTVLLTVAKVAQAWSFRPESFFRLLIVG